MVYVAQIFLGMFLSLQSDGKLSSLRLADWLTLATCVGYLVLLPALAAILMKRRPGTALIVFSTIFVAACFLTLYAWHLKETHFSQGVKPGAATDVAWTLMEVFVRVVPGLWLLVLGAGLGLAFSFQEHPNS
jgi:hypothetical protein